MLPEKSYWVEGSQRPSVLITFLYLTLMGVKRWKKEGRGYMRRRSEEGERKEKGKRKKEKKGEEINKLMIEGERRLTNKNTCRIKCWRILDRCENMGTK